MKNKKTAKNPQIPVNPEHIIEYCQENFINILPNTFSKEAPAETHQKPKHETVAHEK